MPPLLMPFVSIQIHVLLVEYYHISIFPGGLFLSLAKWFDEAQHLVHRMRDRKFGKHFLRCKCQKECISKLVYQFSLKTKDCLVIIKVLLHQIFNSERAVSIIFSPQSSLPVCEL
jgi:hypothetical protein